MTEEQRKALDMIVDRLIGLVRTAHVYRDAGGDMRIAIRYADATEEDRPATSFEVAVSAKISEIAASLQASHLPQNEKHG